MSDQSLPELNEQVLRSLFNEHLRQLDEYLQAIQGYQENRNKTISLLLQSDLQFNDLITFLQGGHVKLTELFQLLEEHQKISSIEKLPQQYQPHTKQKSPNTSLLQNQTKIENELIDDLLLQVSNMDADQLRVIKARILEFQISDAELFDFFEHENQQYEYELLEQFVESYRKEKTVPKFEEIEQFDFVTELSKLGGLYRDLDLNHVIFCQLNSLAGFQDQQQLILSLLANLKIPYHTLIVFLDQVIQIEDVLNYLIQQNDNQNQNAKVLDLFQELTSLGWDCDHVSIIKNKLILITNNESQIKDIISQIILNGVSSLDLIQFLFESDNINLDRLIAFIQEHQQSKTNQLINLNQSQKVEERNQSYVVFDKLLQIQWSQTKIQILQGIILSINLSQEQINLIIDLLIQEQLDDNLVIEYFRSEYTNFEDSIQFICGQNQLLQSLSLISSQQISHIPQTIKYQIPSQFQQDQEIMKLFNNGSLNKYYSIQFINRLSSILFQQKQTTYEKINQIIMSIVDYQQFLNRKQILEICEGKPDKIISQIRKSALDSCFNNQQQCKDLNLLIEELVSLNQHIDLQEVIQLVEEAKIQMKKLKPIKQEDIAIWAKNQTIDRNYKLHLNDLLMICQGVFIFKKYYPRDTQLISVILLMQSQQRGCLAQVYTGEGKSLIVSMFAVLKRLFHCKYIDIITSSEVLAIRDSNSMSQFYQIFNLSSDHNLNKNVRSGGQTKQCYECDIVYGVAHAFMFDILYHEYQLDDTRGTRQFDCIIVDEVDSLLIDGSGQKAYLSSQIPGLKDITKILQLIWIETQRSIKFINQNHQMLIIGPNDDDYLLDAQTYIKNSIQWLLKKEEFKSTIPQFRMDYINFMLEKWVLSSIRAQFYYQENKNYIIEKNDKGIIDVKIVDYDNTGVISQNLRWCNGLHQFLQIKHKLNISTLNLMTNYLSNVGFFGRYENIFGLTGTLGSLSTQQLLQNQYNVDLIFIPPFKQRLLTTLQTSVAENETEWIENICQRTKNEIQMGRAVLIINQAISDATNIDEKMKTLGIKNAKLYINNTDSNNDFISNELKPGDLIIATNLAGRGTDIETSKKLEENGGLHVIVTFLPKNLRVQEQAFGRTARQGKKGTAQLILDLKKSLQGNVEDINYAKKSFEANRKLDLQTSVQNFKKLPKQQIQIQEQQGEFDQSWFRIRRIEQLCQKQSQHQIVKQNNQIQQKKLGQLKLTNLPLVVQMKDVNKLTMNQSQIVLKLPQKYDKLDLEITTQVQANFQNAKMQVGRLKQQNQAKYTRPKTQASRKQREEDEIEEFNEPQIDFGELCIFVRDKNEESYNSQRSSEMKQMLAEDQQFERYCKMLSSIENIRKQTIIFSAIEEEWGIFLVQHKNNIQKLEEFCSKIKLEAELGTIKKNPKQEIKSALEDDLINLEYLKRAINLNKNDWIAYYYAGLTEIKSGIQQNYKSGLHYLAIAKQLLDQRIENIKAFDLALQINQSITTWDSTQNKNLSETVNSQLLNQLKIYDLLQQNISCIQTAMHQFDPERETIIIELKKTKNLITEPSLQFELEEIIADGPLPKVGNLRTIKIERAWWNYALLFALGAIQFIVGAAICAFTGGLAMPIGISLMTAGISDICKAVYSAWNDLPIDWGKWGKDKVISLALTFVQAGPAALSELWNGIQSMQTVSILDIIKQMPAVVVDGTLNAGLYIGEQCMEKLSHVTETFSALEAVDFMLHQQDSKKQLKKVIKGVTMKHNLSKKLADQILEIAQEALIQSKIPGSELLENDFFIENLRKLSAPFMTYLKLKNVCNRTEKDSQNCLKQVTQISVAQLQRQKDYIAEFINLQNKIKQKLIQINKEIIEFVSEDEDISQTLTWLQFYFDQNYDTEQEQRDLIDIDYFPQQLENQIEKNNLELKKEVEELNLDKQQQLNMFYQKTLKKMVMNSLEELKIQIAQKNFAPLYSPTIDEYIALREQFSLEIEQERYQIQRTKALLLSQKADIEELCSNLNQNTDRTQEQIDQYNLQKTAFNEKIELQSQTCDQFSIKVEQYNKLVEIDSDKLTQCIKSALNQLVRQNLILQDGITKKQCVQINQIYRKFQEFFEDEYQQENADLTNMLTNAFQKVYSNKDNFKVSDVLKSRLLEAIDDKIVNFIIQKIFTDKLQGEANKIMQNIASGK